jgi:hypothetical protein
VSLPSDAASPSTPPMRRRRGLWLGLGIALLVVILIVGVGAVFVAPRLCGVTEPQRHGLACDIPLPPNATFVRTFEPPAGTPPGSEILLFHASNTTPDAIHTFYEQQLPSKGWTCVQTGDPLTVRATQGKRSVSIVLAPLAQEGADVPFVVNDFTFASEFDPPSC